MTALLASMGARKIIAMDLIEERLRVASEMGATHCLNTSDAGDGGVAHVRAICGEDSPSHSAEC